VSAPLLEVRDLVKRYRLPRERLLRPAPVIEALRGVSFAVHASRSLGIVGESGSGKSTLARLVMALETPTEGSVLMAGRDLNALSPASLIAARRDFQMVFQDPYGSLDPRQRVGRIVAEPLIGAAPDEAHARVAEALNAVGLRDTDADKYPHEFSGGQRQRIGIARALALSPSFIVCDEPISALDVSIQAQVINLLEDLQKEMGLTYLFIAHDLSMVRHIADRVAVMYLGRLMEMADREELYANPLHPYTQALFSAVPVPDPYVEDRRQRIILTGDPPSPANPPPGCPFNTRCPLAIDLCRQQVPEWRTVSPGHYVACHRV